MLPSHLKITRIALGAAGRFGFALAGGYAVSAHGMGSRLSGDVDLFTDRNDTFARLLVYGNDPGGEPDKLEMSADWRAHAPVMSPVGPVLHPDDAVANKMCALFGRAEARDFLDVDAALLSGQYTRERLLELAAAADPGFDPRAFADALGALTQITDEDFDCYGLPAAELPAVRDRFAHWRRELTDTP
ncbi:nucleotidyl transferase AbiEii/AbiGii toxin family protein [Micromonospora sp. NPDC085948]|uniref:nucleotidyl transferase AbiEii/AbiGii toxin family protein n=2 Tax=Micromonospora TaxID=1873 RepID=UPI0034169C55